MTQKKKAQSKLLANHLTPVMICTIMHLHHIDVDALTVMINGRVTIKNVGRLRSSILNSVEEDIVAYIRTRGLAPGSMLPGFNTIASAIDAAPATVQRAISALAAKGIVRCERRRGTFLERMPDLSYETPALGVRPYTLASVTQDQLRARVCIITAYMFSPEEIGSAERQRLHWPLAIIYSLERVLASESEIEICFKTHRNETPDLSRLTREAVEEGADAIIYVEEPHDAIEEAMSFIRSLTIPYIFVSTEIMRNAPRVYSDQLSCGYQAARHLLSRGYDRLLFYSAIDLEFVRYRIDGARQALRDFGFGQRCLKTIVHGEQVAIPDFETATQSEFDTTLLDGVGVIAANDLTAYGILSAAAESGLAAGEHFGIVGFDDWARSRALALTTLRPPLDALGSECARVLLSALRGDEITQELCIKWQLIPRRSTRSLVETNTHNEVTSSTSLVPVL